MVPKSRLLTRLWSRRGSSRQSALPSPASCPAALSTIVTETHLSHSATEVSSNSDLESTISSDSIFSQTASRESKDEAERGEEKKQNEETIKSPLGSISSHGSAEKSDLLYDTKIQSKKRKYFAEKTTTKNIFKKLLHPSYYERRMQFRKLFGDQVDESDLFLTSYSCAYHREILAHGRMYLSQRRICFYANIFGWETNLIIPINEIVTITKERAALIFPNSLQIERCTGEKYFFASFANRDKSYGVLQAVHQRVLDGDVISPEQLWEFLKLEHHRDDLSPTKLRSSINKSSTAAFFNSAPSTPLANESAMSMFTSPSAAMTPSLQASDCLNLSNSVEFPDPHNESSSHSSIEDYQSETECTCPEHLGKLCLDAVYPFSAGEFFELLFNDGEANNSWFRTKYLPRVKHEDYKSSPWTKANESGEERRTCTYSISVSASPFGPKICKVTEKQILKYVVSPKAGFTIQKESQNSGVPYADAFVIDTTYCVNRISRMECRVKVHCGVRFKKPPFSFIKNLIDRQSMSGIDEHYATLEKLLNEEALQKRLLSGREREDGQDLLEGAGAVEILPGGEEGSSNSATDSIEDVRHTSNIPDAGTGKSHALPKMTASPLHSSMSLRRRRKDSRHRLEAHKFEPMSTSSVPFNLHQQMQHETDYGGYIRVIIGLLAGLLLLNLMLLMRMHFDDRSKIVPEAVIWQLQKDIQELHHSIRELKAQRGGEL